MGKSFQTLGNASVIVRQHGAPVLATDPWLTGTCYHGSWALDHDLTPEEISAFRTAPTIWISHGHPDHLHEPSLDLLSRDTEIMVPRHYTDEMETFLRSKGFTVRVMEYREWIDLAEGIRILTLQNENQDAMLVIDTGECLIIDMNDAPPSGEQRFLRGLARGKKRSYLLAICSNDADLFNTYDSDGRFLGGEPDEKKPGTILSVADLARSIGVTHFCCSSSQHVYVRKDSAWANPFRITWKDMRRNWPSTSGVELVEPFVTVDLETGAIRKDNPEQVDRLDRVTDACGDDDWSEPLTDDDWSRVEAFFLRMPLLKENLDWLAFTVGGETRRLELNPTTRPESTTRGIRFEAPRHSLMETIDAGYFDDLLIGNFIRAHLQNARLYPHFTPIVAKLAGNAKVLTAEERRAFHSHYKRMSPHAWRADRVRTAWLQSIRPKLRSLGRGLGVLEPLKRVERLIFRRSRLPVDWPPPSENGERDRVRQPEESVGRAAVEDDGLRVNDES